MITDEGIRVIELSEEEQREIQRDHPEIARGESALVISAPRSLLHALQELITHMAWEKGKSDQLLDLLTEDIRSKVLPPERLAQIGLQAKARERFLETYATLSSAEVAELSGSSAGNRSAVANRWKKAGKIFAIPLPTGDRFPAFQFKDGRPVPIMREILPFFEGENGWTIALWFASPSDWLDGGPPAKHLAKDPEAVLEAARHSSEPLAA